MSALLPGITPQHAVIVAQQTHQLSNSNRRVRVVQVNGNLIGKIVQAAMLFQMVEENILQGRGDEEIFWRRRSSRPAGVLSSG